jgi:hypothetical protein
MAQMKPFRFPSEGTQQLFEAVLADGNFVDIPDFPSFSRSVSAFDRVASSGPAGAPEQSRTLRGGWRLACLDHKVHCDAEFCQGPQQTPPRRKCEHYTVSNLRPFSVQVELQVGSRGMEAVQHTRARPRVPPACLWPRAVLLSASRALP